MKNISIIALASALAFSTLAIGAGVSTNATTAASGQLGASASASVGGASVGASTSAEVSASASASASASEPGTSSIVSGVSSIVSSAVSGESSMMSSASSSCEQLNTSGMSMAAIDPAALAAVTSVTVDSVGGCAGLPTGTLDAGAGAALGANPNVTAALKTAGFTAGQIVGYTLSGTSLTVYVKA